MAGAGSAGGRGGEDKASSSSSEEVFFEDGGRGGGGLVSELLFELIEKSGELKSAAEDPTARATVVMDLRCGEETRFARDALDERDE